MKKDMLKMSDKDIIKIARQLRIAYKLKRTMRYATTRDLSYHNESVAEHLFALFFLAEYFLPLEKNVKHLDIAKLYRLLLFHDFGEIKYGDVPTHDKTDIHRERERKAASEIFASLPKKIGTLAYKSWREYELQKSPEAKFAYALDKTEPCFEFFDPVNEKSLRRMKTTYEMHMNKKIPPTKDFPIMRKFVDVLSMDLKRRNVFWTGKSKLVA